MRSDQVFPKAINGTFSSTRGGSSAARAHDWPDYRDSRCVRPAAHCHRCQCLHTAGGAGAEGSDLARFFTAQHIQSRQARLLIHSHASQRAMPHQQTVRDEANR